MPHHPADANCIFCKIVAGAIPCWKLFEDEHVLAFLDIGPLSRGHAMVIPKGHYVTLDELPDEVAAACAIGAKHLGEAVRKVTRCAGWNVLQNNGSVAGQVVMHVHFHVIPRSEGDKLGFRWPAGKLGESDAKELQSEIKKQLN